MLRSTLKSLAARKLRLVMSAMAIVLGVGFVTGSLIFTDTLGRTFDGIVEGTVGDVVVQAEGADFESTGDSSAVIPAEDLAPLEDLDGVERVDGNVDAMGVFVVGENGNVVGGQGAPAMAFNHTDAPNQLGKEVVEYDQGRAPTGEDEVAVDSLTAERAGLALGDTVQMVTAGEYPQLEAELVGTFEFGEGGMAGASITLFDTATAQKYFLGGEDAYTSAWLTTQDGAEQEVADAAAGLVPDGFEARTGKAIADETADQIEEGLSFITTFLLVFAGVALFVGSFLIINTFSILVAQRGRELAMLRAIGASRRQVTMSVLVEALVVGIVGSTLGLALGVLLAMAIQALFGTLGLDLSGTGLVFTPRTVIAAYAVGVLVTLLAAYIPARRAGQVAPVEAMRESSGTSGGHPIRRALEVALLVVGVAVFLAGLFVVEDNQVWWFGAGLVLTLLGTAFLSPIVGLPVIRGLGWLYRKVFGSVGRMAEENAVRAPGRTAATASALMIGMTLVALMGVLSSSASASIDKQIEDTFTADYIYSNAIGQPFSPKVAEQAADVDGVRAVSPVRFAAVELDGERQFVQAVDPQTFGEVEDIEITEGENTLDPSSVLVGSSQQEGRSIGDTLTLTSGGQSTDLTITGFYDEIAATQNDQLLVSIDALESLGAQAADNWVFVFLDEGADQEAVKADLESVIEGQPLVTLKDQQSYSDEQRASINQLLYLIYALLGLAIVIAILGIVNTLGLSVMERTREIGLLRAVGLSRGQLRRMIRLESITIALLGAVLGIGLGVVGGVAIQRALEEDGITVLSIPWLQLLVFLVLAAVIGVLAALWPAFRASRMDVLQAISTE